jgi:hypothetical protein
MGFKDKRNIEPPSINLDFVDRFSVNFQDAIENGAITECHLFAAGLMATLYGRLWLYFKGRSEDFEIHFEGFMAVREHLLKRESLPSSQFSLPILHPFMLSHLTTHFVYFDCFNRSQDRRYLTQDRKDLAADILLKLELKDTYGESILDERNLRISFLASQYLHRSATWDGIFDVLATRFDDRLRVVFGLFWPRERISQLAEDATEKAMTEKAMTILLISDFELVIILEFDLVQKFLNFVNPQKLNLTSDEGV